MAVLINKTFNNISYLSNQSFYPTHVTRTPIFSLESFILVCVLVLIIPIIIMFFMIDEYIKFLIIGNYLGIIILLNYLIFNLINRSEFIGSACIWMFLMMYIILRGHHEL